MSRSVAVLIPCFNEEKSITEVVKSFAKVLPKAEIFVYDNNSTDNTAKLAKQAGAIVVKEPRQGKGNAVRSMFRDIDADIYIMVDGDNTYSAEDAPKMVELVEAGADMVVGDRLSSTYFNENKRFGHNFGNVLVRRIINTFFHAKIKDIMTGYRAFSRRFVKTCPILSDGFQIETEMTIHALDKRMNIVTTPVSYKDRTSDNPSKLNTFSDGAKVLMTIFNLIKEYKPLAFFSSISVILFILSLVLSIPVFVEFVDTGLVMRFPTLFVAGMIMVLSLLSFSTGLILDTIAKKHRQLFEVNLGLVCKK